MEPNTQVFFGEKHYALKGADESIYMHNRWNICMYVCVHAYIYICKIYTMLLVRYILSKAHRKFVARNHQQRRHPSPFHNNRNKVIFVMYSTTVFTNEFENPQIMFAMFNDLCYNIQLPFANSTNPQILRANCTATWPENTHNTIGPDVTTGTHPCKTWCK